MQGEEINRCIFDFVNGAYSYKKDDVLKLPDKESGKTGFVLCEGLHGIDEGLPHLFQKMKNFLFISLL